MGEVSDMLGFGKKFGEKKAQKNETPPEKKDPQPTKSTKKRNAPGDGKEANIPGEKRGLKKKRADKKQGASQGKTPSAQKGAPEGEGGGPKPGAAGQGQNSQKEIPEKIADCEALIRSTFHNSSDMVVEAFDTRREKAMIVYIDGLLNKDLMDRDIITPLKSEAFDGDLSASIHTHFRRLDDFNLCVNSLINSNVVIFYEGSKAAFAADLRQWNTRSVEAPDSESVIRGPKEGFTESIRTNTSLLRRKIKNPNLVFEDLELGRQTNTIITLAFVKGIVNRNVLREVKARLSQIDVDAILESGYIEQFLDQHQFSPISGMGLTQKPDVAAGRILEGRVAILCDGTPHVITIPELFIENLHTSEDYYSRILQAFILRTLRLVGLFIGVMLPGLSVAIFTYNQEMLPSSFLTHLIISTQKTPFPSALEAFFLILMFELLRESGTRLPKAVGSAISIVGSLIIGEAAVSAGIVGAPMVIIIALTAVASFIVPNLTEFILIYRLLFLFLGATMGLIGIGAGIMIMLTQVISTESFGIPILSSFSKQELKDTIFRFPLKTMKFRPRSIAKDNIRRMK